MTNKVTSYKDLVVWQKAMDLVIEVYALTESFPKSEQFGIISQMRRAAVSIPSNIAEGRRRSSKADFQRFLQIAYGSGCELETQLLLGRRLRMAPATIFPRSEALLDEVMRMLNVMTR